MQLSTCFSTIFFYLTVLKSVLMATIHFFTDPNQLKIQVANDAYGPVSGNETTEYLTTLKGFLNEDAPVFATCSSKVYLQPHATIPSLVNIVLSPYLATELQNDFTRVKYIVYKGVKKANLLDENNQILSETDTNASPLIRKIWEAFNQMKIALNIEATTPTNKSLGWQYATTPGTTSIEEVIYSTDQDHEVYSVSAGTQLGEFQMGAEGIEIILGERMYLPDLNNIRAPKTIITATTPTVHDLPGNEAISNMRKRENILNYIDPVAWHMLFHEKGINYANGQSAVGFQQIYTVLLENFFTSNHLYIDIRNENGYSLNYYKDNEGDSSGSNYGSHIKSSWDGNLFNIFNYYENYWPILTLTPPVNGSSNFNELTIKFRKLYNPSPLIYTDFALKVEYGELKPRNSTDKFLEESEGASSIADWSEAFDFPVPNINSLSPSNTQAPWIIKLINIRLEMPSIALPASVVSRDFPLDNVFGPLQELPSFAQNVSTQWLVSYQKRFLKIKDFSGIYAVTIGVDSQDVGYYLSMLDEYVPKGANFLTPPAIYPQPRSGISYEDSIVVPFNEGILSNSNFELNQKKLTISDNEESVILVLPPILPSGYIATGGAGSLLITKDQHSAMLNLATGLDDSVHEILFQFVQVEEKADDNQQDYYEADLQLVGLDINGVYTSALSTLIVRGVQILSLKTSLAQITVEIHEQDPIISYDHLFASIKKVDKVYKDVLRHDDTPDKSVTRIRVHSFGYPGNGFLGKFEAIAFSKTIPDAPYIEPKPNYESLCTVQGEPFTIGFFTSPDLRCRIRQLYENEIGANIYASLTEMVLLNHKGILLDITHALYGMDVLLNGGVNSLPDIYYQNAFGIDYSLDLASFIGDIASTLVGAYIKYGNNPTSTEFDDEYSRKFGSADQYGDIDSFGLNAAYNEVLSSTPDAGLADVFEHYYGNHIPSDPTTHYTKRFARFAMEWDLIDYAGNWKGSNSSYYQDFINRVLNISNFLFFTESRFEKYTIGLELILNLDNTVLDVSEVPQYSVQDVEYLIDKFLQFIQTGYQNE